MNKIEIDWLDSCPKCDCSEHVVETVEGTKDWLYNGDKVTCGECGHTGEIEADGGSFKFGTTITAGYFPKDNTKYFQEAMNLVDWLRPYSKNQEESYLRGFLGRMLFSGEETQKMATILSGGEKVRCMFSRLMLQEPNFLMFDDPTNHLDLESITSLNKGLIAFPGTILLRSNDHELLSTVCNRVIELTPQGFIDRTYSYDEYLAHPDIKQLRAEMGAAIEESSYLGE